MTKVSFNPDKVRLYQPLPSSHKGQNGKLLVIGGSKLFHSSIFWSADVASKIVDLVHLTSPANENNQIFRKRLKEKFWNGIVVDWKDVEEYIKEDDCILIGPGMIRRKADQGIGVKGQGLKEVTEKDDTKQIVNSLLQKYPTKKWIIDGGALQEVEPELITESCILTPHKKEFERVVKKIDKDIVSLLSCYLDESKQDSKYSKIAMALQNVSKKLHNCTILFKGPVDIVCQGDRYTVIPGGNPGMAKGGTGDVLAGLVAAFYTKNDSWTAATTASYINKKAGDNLYKQVGPYFNAEDLVQEVPLTIYGIM